MKPKAQLNISFIRAVVLCALFCTGTAAPAQDLNPRQFAEGLESGKFRYLEEGKRLVDGSGKLVAKEVAIDKSKGEVSFTPTPTHPWYLKPKLSVKPSELPSLGATLGGKDDSRECAVACTSAEVCKPCASAPQPGDECCQPRIMCKRDCNPQHRPPADLDTPPAEIDMSPALE
ncbi:MAG: hypothetical protein ACRETN_02090 [Nevskiales bacterium]